MIHVIDSKKLNMPQEMPCNLANSTDLRREGRVFFIGGDLPVYSTLETMYESYCQESTELFYVTFGEAGAFEQNLEMVRQIKRNFSTRLMGRVSTPIFARQVEQAYLAGLDIIDIPLQKESSHSGAGSDDEESGRWDVFGKAAAIFTRWSITSSISSDHATPDRIHETIKKLLDRGVVPLLVCSGDSNVRDTAEINDLFRFLAAEWHRHRVPLRPITPLLRLTTPFVFRTSTGFLSDVLGKLQDRRILATTDIRRHLRTSGAVASFESAGL